jgi:hypothetical protein
MATAHLTWTPSTGLQQEVQYKKASDASFTVYQTVSSSTNTIDIPGLDPNTVYEFLILNQCVYGLQTPSSTEEAALITCPTITVEQGGTSLSVSVTDLDGEVDSFQYELRLAADNSLVTAGSGSVPATNPVAVFEGLDPNTYYIIKVIPKIGTSFENDTCSVTQRTLGCAEDYTMAPDGSYCYKIEETDPTPPSGGTPDTAAEANNDVYSTLGSFIYDFGFNVNGTGTTTRISLSNPFWVNGPGDGGNHTLTDGPLNRCGLWTTTTLNDQDIGFSVCINLPETKVYYIGIAGDNSCKIVIDGTVVVNQDPTAVATQFGYGLASTFKAWHIYPFTLSSGPHTIELIGHNDDGDAAMGAEIYNNTAAEIAAATSYTDLNLVFSTKDYIGQPVQLGSDSLGYTCPSGYSLAACTEPYVCRRILTALPT